MRLRIFREPQQGATYDDLLAAVGAKAAYLQILDVSDLEHLGLIAAEVMPEVGAQLEAV